MKKLYSILIIILIYVLVILLINEYGNDDILSVFLSLGLMIPIIFLINDRYKQKTQIAKLKEESLQAELSLLKSQINPHFFFNTLNNLYGLAIEKSELTTEVIAKLSDMMRFTIYEGRRESVFIKDEIEYLNNFIQIHIMRYKNKVDLKFETEIENQNQRIPPLLFINLLENAFKHGASSVIENAYIHMKLICNSKRLEFYIENNYEVQTRTKKKGIGISNLKRRLELLFPNKHQFTNSSNDMIYKTTVRISLL
jgi:two-component system, LytTR family, sensor histidine kinase AlgZ